MPKATYKRRPDGRYRIKYNGHEFYSSPWGPLHEAVQQVEAYKKDIARGLKEETLGICFATYAIDWVQTYKAECSKQTYNAYIAMINKTIDQIGNMRMQDITRTDIQKLYNSLKGKSDSYIKKYCMTINSIFETAMHDGVVLRNPCFGASRPSGKSGTHRPITAEERNLIHQSVGHHDMAIGAMIMLYAGLRRGELLALDSSCIDKQLGVINVSKAVSFDGNKPIAGNPKTEAGVRSIPLFEPLKSALDGIDGYIIKNENGGMMTQTAFKRKWESYISYLEQLMNGCHKRWYGRTKAHKDILSRGGKLPPWKECTIRPHDLRHSFATMLYDSDVDIKTAVHWMGHSDEKMIMQIYAHLTEERKKRSEMQVARHVENLIKGSNPGSDQSKAAEIIDL